MLEDLISNQLPNTLEPVFKRKDDSCNYCKKQLGFLKKTRHNCYKCGASVCEKCAQHKMQLSKKDENKYRVCNMCFAITQNKPIINFYKELDKAKKTRLDGLAMRKRQYRD